MADWCPTHPKYSAKRQPNSLCGECWRLWFLRNPEDKDRMLDTYRDCEKLREHMLKP